MAVFRDAQHFYDTVGALMDLAKYDPEIGKKIAKSGLNYSIPLLPARSNNNGECER